jgi:UDPglucose 6-dehydrogenase/GDP-mannose 6-dehydrogenase
MKVSIIGTGYVGLVTGVCLAEKGHQVICVDVDAEKTDKINHGISPIHEKGLEDLLRRNLGIRLNATTDLEVAVLETDITLIAVGTPFNGSEIDLTYIRNAASQIGSALRNKSAYHVVAVKSTVVPGTTDQVVRPLLEETSSKKAGIDFGVGMNPEFLTEGEAIQDFMYPDRIVLGGMDENSLLRLEQLYGVFPGIDVVRTNNSTAEMIKYTSNALLATMISFSNEIGNLCSALGGIDVADVMRGLQLSKYLSVIQPDGTRIKPDINGFLWAGCGFGGSCLPKDVKALIAHGETAGRPMPLLKAVIEINEEQHHQVLIRLRKHFDSLHGVHIGVLGLAFRPETDDMRESPAIPIVKELLTQGAVVKAYDPVANENAHKILGNGRFQTCENLMQAITDVEAVVLITSWQEFKTLPESLTGIDPQPVVIDGRRMLEKKSIAKYEGIGL